MYNEYLVAPRSVLASDVSPRTTATVEEVLKEWQGMYMFALANQNQLLHLSPAVDEINRGKAFHEIPVSPEVLRGSPDLNMEDWPFHHTYAV